MPLTCTVLILIYIIPICLQYVITPVNADVEEVEETIAVMLGGDVILTCASRKTSSLSIAPQWRGPGNRVIATRGQISPSLDQSKYRVISGSPSEASSLIIHRKGLEDDGLYQCLDANTLTTLRTINVTILVAVQSIALLQPSGGINEGSEIKVKCVTDGSKPAPEIHWIKKDHDGKRLQLSGTNEDIVKQNGTVRRTNTLALTVDRSDYLASYTCLATVTVSVFTRQAVWKPDVYLSPVEPWLEYHHQNYTEGDTANFQCVTSGSKPKARILWFVNNQPVSDSYGLTTNQEREDEDGTFSSRSRLVLEVSRDMNGADVRCSVTNSVLTSEGQGPRNASIRITVEYTPRVNITSLTPVLKEGEEARFTCTTDAQPPVTPDHVYLALNDGFLPETRLRRTGEQISVMNVTRMDRGQYRCVAKNNRGASSSLPTFLSLQFSPVCNYSGIRNIYALLGRAISVPCPMTAFPHDALVTWTSRPTNKTLHTETATKWSTDDVIESDFRFVVRTYGDITCFARNSIGKSSVPCTMRLAKPEPPAAPTNCIVRQLPEASRQLRCREGEDGGSLQTFLLRIQALDTTGDVEEVTRAERPSFLLDHLSSDAEFNLTVCAVSQSFPNTDVCAPSLLLRKDSADTVYMSSASTDGKSTQYIVLGTVLGCCFIVSVILIIIVCRRWRQRSRTLNRPGKTYDEEFSSHQRESIPPDMEYGITAATNNVSYSCQPCHPAHSATEVNKALLTTATSTSSSTTTAARIQQEKDLARHSSRSRSTVENIRYQPSTKTYVKMEKTDQRTKEETSELNTDSAPTDQDISVFKHGDRQNKPLLGDDDTAMLSGVITDNNSYEYNIHRYLNEKETTQAQPEIREMNHSYSRNHTGILTKLQGNAEKFPQGRSENRVDQQNGFTTSPASVLSSETDRADLKDQEDFSEMLRKTLQKNRRSLLPEKKNARPHLTASNPPLLTFLGTSAYPPSSLSASQTSLSSCQQLEASDIYDVPRNRSDWQRAMSLLSLSAIGSGVLPQAQQMKTGYIDMSRRAGSVPDLDKLGLISDEDTGDEKRSNYFLMPSNKPAYINLVYPHHRQIGSKHRKQNDNGDSSCQKTDSSRHFSGADKINARSDRGRPRRCSSSEQKTHELISCPPSTATLTAPTARQSFPANSTHAGYRSSGSSVRLSPTPRLKLHLRHENASESSGKEQMHAETPVYFPRKTRAVSPEDSPTYVKMEGNADASTPRFHFDVKCRDYREKPTELHQERDEREVGSGNHGASSEVGRPRLPSLQRNPSYSQAVCVQNPPEHFALFPPYMQDYVIIPTPSSSWSSASSSAKESNC